MVFLFPAFLFGLFSLAIPIIIHLVEMRRPKRVVFTNVAFLREVKELTASSRRLKRLLILACRLLALTALVLAFAQPFRPARRAGSGPLDDIRLYLDNSLSMQQASATAAVPLLDEAKSQIRQLTAVLGATTRFRFLDNGFSGGQTATAAPALLDALARTTYSARTVPTGAAVQRLLNPGAGSSGTDVGRAAAPKVFVYSDFQRNTFDPALLTRLSRENPTADLYLLPLQAQATRNVTVDTVLLTDEFVRPDAPNRLLVRVANRGVEKATGVAVKVFVDEQQASAFALDLAPGEVKTTEVDFRLPASAGITPGATRRGRVEVADVPVTFDNTYYFTLRVAPPIRVFGLSAGTTATPAQQAFGAEPAFQFTAATERSLNYRTAAETNLLLVQELPTLSAGVSENLRKFVQGGGTALLVPPATGNAPDRASYDAFFRATGLTQVRWRPAPGGAPERLPLAPPAAADPFFRGVFTAPVADLTMPRVAPLLTWGRSTTDVLRLRRGEPYLSGFRVGRGTLWVLAAPLTAAYSDFAANALFVPVLYKLAQTAYRAPQGLAYALGRQPIALSVQAADARKDVFRLVRTGAGADSASFIPDQTLRDGRLVFTLPGELTQAGFYTLRKPGEAPTVLAFNYDKRESDLAQYPAEELKTLLKDVPRLHIYEPGAGAGAVARFQADAFGQPLWQYAIAAALAFLLAEVLLVRFLK